MRDHGVICKASSKTRLADSACKLMPPKYVHTNLLSRDWRRLADFYEEVFGCVRLLPEVRLVRYRAAQAPRRDLPNRR
jgi:hypothetical protein